MTDEELKRAFEADSGLPYSLSDEDLQRLLALVGEYEPIIDAIMERGGQSYEARAEAIGCSPDYFYDYYGR